MELQVVISAAEMVTPIGMNLSQTFASLRADITRMREAGDIYWCRADDPDFEDGAPLVASTLSYLEPQRKQKNTPAQWLAHIAAQAFNNLREKAQLSLPQYRELGLFMGLPPQQPGWGPEQEEQFCYHFHNTIEMDLFPVAQFSFTGHAGALSLFESTRRALASGQIRYALLGGVDSYLFPEWLENLDQNYRIKSDRNLDGFIPGEGAAFLLLEPAGQPEKRGLSPLAAVTAAIQDRCPATEVAHNTGVALSKTLSHLLEASPQPPIIVCDLNGEPARMKEWGYTYSRLGERLGVPLALEHPVDVLGDMGAASGAMFTALAILYLQKKYAQHASALIWTASDTGERAAMLIEKK
ncbi:MAG: beta-ketoacyl synthase N-terminal-like domain-containing protein [Desulfobacteraceae bacterium]|nr:beta-ketoacyl synthase N-terminal-like domain-containing protein [Desulfobacteraceae bacterium]